VISQSDNNEFTLTTHRIRQETKKWGKASLTSIMLEELCSCSLKYKRNIIALIIAGIIGGIFLISGIIEGSGDSIFFGLIALAIGFVFDNFTKKTVISFASNNGNINLLMVNSIVKDAEKIEAKKIIDKVEAAKNERYLSLSPKG